jgi:hypothetical protein
MEIGRPIDVAERIGLRIERTPLILGDVPGSKRGQECVKAALAETQEPPTGNHRGALAKGHREGPSFATMTKDDRVGVVVGAKRVHE